MRDRDEGERNRIRAYLDSARILASTLTVSLVRLGSYLVYHQMSLMARGLRKTAGGRSPSGRSSVA